MMPAWIVHRIARVNNVVTMVAGAVVAHVKHRVSAHLMGPAVVYPIVMAKNVVLMVVEGPVVRVHQVMYAVPRDNVSVCQGAMERNVVLMDVMVVVVNARPAFCVLRAGANRNAHQIAKTACVVMMVVEAVAGNAILVINAKMANVSLLASLIANTGNVVTMVVEAVAGNARLIRDVGNPLDSVLPTLMVAGKVPWLAVMAVNAKHVPAKRTHTAVINNGTGCVYLTAYNVVDVLILYQHHKDISPRPWP